jgi:hypothetical protein
MLYKHTMRENETKAIHKYKYIQPSNYVNKFSTHVLNRFETLYYDKDQAFLFLYDLYFLLLQLRRLLTLIMQCAADMSILLVGADQRDAVQFLKFNYDLVHK